MINSVIESKCVSGTGHIERPGNKQITDLFSDYRDAITVGVDNSYTI